MPLVVKDRIKESSSTAGTGTLTLAGAATGFRSFADIGNGNTTYYAIVDTAAGTWEVGIGTYTSSGTTLSRDTVLSNSLGTTAKINFAANIKEVFVTYPASKSLFYDGSDELVIGASRVDMQSNMAPTGNGTASSISGTTLTVGGTVTGTFAVGDRVYGTGVEQNTFITALGTGTGGAGTYTVSNTQTVTSRSISSIGGGINVFRFTDTDTTASAGQAMGRIEWYSSDSSTPGAGVKAYISGVSETNTPDSSLVFGTSDNIASTQAVERMRIDSSGDVGINTTSPAYRFDVVGVAAATQVAAKNGMFINSNAVSESYTIPTNFNALSSGNVTVNTGVTVTVPSNSRWVVV